MRNLVILGGGYGGMRILLRLLPNQLPEDVQITLVDRNPYHGIKTEYYALAAGTASDQHIRLPFPEHPRLKPVYGNVLSVDLEKKQVHIENQEPISYDDLVIGLGCEDKYHNIPGAKENTHSIQTIGKSRKTYSAINNLPASATVSIIGGGLSGIEMASELIESRPDLNVKLLDRGPRVLSAFPEKLSYFVESWFKKHNIEIVHHTNITKIEPNKIYNDDEIIESDVIVWTAGIQPSKVVRALDIEKDEQGRAILTPQHHLPTDNSVFVVGDCASLPYAPSAQLAEFQGEQIVQVLVKKWANQPLPSQLPEFKSKGTLGSLGKKQGFGLVANKSITGRFARLIKSGILWQYKFQND